MNESAQTANFLITANSNQSIFSVLPKISLTGVSRSHPSPRLSAQRTSPPCCVTRAARERRSEYVGAASDVHDHGARACRGQRSHGDRYQRSGSALGTAGSDVIVGLGGNDRSPPAAARLRGAAEREGQIATGTGNDGCEPAGLATTRFHSVTAMTMQRGSSNDQVVVATVRTIASRRIAPELRDVQLS